MKLSAIAEKSNQERPAKPLRNEVPPHLLVPVRSGIPEELRDLPQWVLWRADWNEARQKWNKIPTDARTGRNASSTDPRGWVDFETAWAAYERAVEESEAGKSWGGVGFVLCANDPYAVIDLDRCVDHFGKVSDAARPVIARFLGTYTELSVSGQGLHIWMRATLPVGGRVSGVMEMYDSQRFLTMTGNCISPEGGIRDFQQEVEEFHGEIFTPKIVVPVQRAAPSAGTVLDSDTELLRRMGLAANGAAITTLLRGEWEGVYASQSEADLALCNHFAFWTNCDPQQMDRIFRSSGLWREKWDTRHGAQTYGEMTLARAIDGCGETYAPPGVAGSGLPRPALTEANGEEQPVAGTLPTIQINNRQLRDVTREAWAALVAAQNGDQKLFVRNGEMVQIRHDEHGAARIGMVTTAELRAHVARAANFVRQGKTTVQVSPPLEVVEDLQAAMNPFAGLSPLLSVVPAPVLAPDYSLITRAGYHGSARVFCEWRGQIEDGMDVRSAILLFDRMLADFPFADEASYAHAIALLILPFARPAIAGPTPFHLVDAPSPGTGKTLLVETLLSVYLGEVPASSAEPGRQDEEWRKWITTMLVGGAPVAFLDNVSGKLGTAALAHAVTATTISDRLLGGNHEVRVPVQCVWVATANNGTLFEDFARRVVSIRLDAQVERPEDRQGFGIADLRGWVREHRAELVSAAIAIVRHWVASGCVPYGGAVMGSFEAWTRVMGGILESAGIVGFLSNSAAMRERVDPERVRWREFVAGWWKQFRGHIVSVSQLVPLAVECDLMPSDERGERNKFGRQLRAQMNRVYGETRIEDMGTRQRLACYGLVWVGGEEEIFEAESSTNGGGADYDPFGVESD